MKTILNLIFLISAISLTAQEKAAPVKFIEATSQHWVSGAPGGRTGNKYAIKVYIATDKKVEFKNMWIGKENVSFDVEFFSLDIPKKIEHGDYLLLTYNQINGERNENTGAKRIPIRCKVAAFVEFLLDGKAHYMNIKAFTEVPPLRGQ